MPLASLLPENNNEVKLDIITTDKYSRKVSVVYLPNGEIVQEKQVKEGWAFPYYPYSQDCPVWDKIMSAESIAIDRGVNIYSKGIEKPWEYRKRKN
ncbi:thermonuclease family protein [Geminocystis sp. NIES-3709]|uniref:thermonuclease family protein n=1 Tax=Geminocystis sp. NIES-3709 TaxID=1617448 RepID=UPI0005FCC209|nr:thermonuclease family protein [Geminocystis sp. NIES-3709]BAQ63935.1 hypothetical protein GM3709_700 [Geminocystis sp. NIES-3709]